MRLSAFRTRILLGAVLTALLALVMVIVTVTTTFEVNHPRSPVVSRSAYEACRANPGPWSEMQVGGRVVRSFDEAGTSADPTAEPLDMTDLHTMTVGETHSRDALFTRYFVYRAASEGPCAYMTLSARPPKEVRGLLPWALAAGTFLAVLVAGVATYGFTVAPLLRRIDRIRGAAVEVGRERYHSGNDEVGDQLAEIAQVLDTSHGRIVADREELMRRHEALEQYMAGLAHDLRTPLASLLLALQDVEAASLEDPSAVRRALQDANYVATLVENLHHAVRLRHGLDPTGGHTDLREVVGRLEVRFRTLGRVQDVAVAASLPEDPVVVRCVPALAERAIANLLHNAITHGGEHAAVLLSSHGGQFELVVLDDGEGVPERERQELAKRTFTDDQARPRHQGLGLAITNEIAHRLGWTISYEGAEEGGLRITLTGPEAPRDR